RRGLPRGPSRAPARVPRGAADLARGLARARGLGEEGHDLRAPHQDLHREDPEGAIAHAKSKIHLEKSGANGRASKTTRIEAILPSRTLYHSAMNAVPAGVLVSMS